MAAGAGDLESVKLLVARGAVIDRYGLTNHTPLWHAARRNRLNVVEFLLAQGATTQPGHPERPFLAAREAGHQDVAIALWAGERRESFERFGERC